MVLYSAILLVVTHPGIYALLPRDDEQQRGSGDLIRPQSRPVPSDVGGAAAQWLQDI